MFLHLFYSNDAAGADMGSLTDLCPDDTPTDEPPTLGMINFSISILHTSGNRPSSMICGLGLYNYNFMVEKRKDC